MRSQIRSLLLSFFSHGCHWRQSCGSERLGVLFSSRFLLYVSRKTGLPGFPLTASFKRALHFQRIHVVCLGICMLPKAPYGSGKSWLFCLFLQSQLSFITQRQLICYISSFHRLLLRAAFVNCLPATYTECNDGSCIHSPLGLQRGPRHSGGWEVSRKCPSFHPVWCHKESCPFCYHIFPNWYQQLLSSLHKANRAVSLFCY